MKPMGRGRGTPVFTNMAGNIGQASAESESQVTKNPKPTVAWGSKVVAVRVGLWRRYVNGSRGPEVPRFPFNRGARRATTTPAKP
jgi:hypothetical protein